MPGFYFNNPTTVSYERDSIFNCFFKLQILSNEIRVTSASNFFVIHTIDVDGPILINEQNGSLEVYLRLNKPPRFFEGKERASYDFSERSFNLRLFRNASAHPKAALNLRKALENFSLQVINVCHLVERNLDMEMDLETTKFSASEAFSFSAGLSHESLAEQIRGSSSTGTNESIKDKRFLS